MHQSPMPEMAMDVFSGDTNPRLSEFDGQFEKVSKLFKIVHTSR